MPPLAISVSTFMSRANRPPETTGNPSGSFYKLRLVFHHEPGWVQWEKVRLLPPRSDDRWRVPGYGGAVFRNPDVRSVVVLLGLALVLWAPRLGGPIDLRYDAGVYYVLGTALAEGKGYRLLNEPGAIQAIQYPPLLPLFVAVHQRLSGHSDPLVVGRLLRISFFALLLALIVAAY